MRFDFYGPFPLLPYTFQFQKLRQKFEALQTLFFRDIKLADIHAFCKIFVLSKYAQKQLFFIAN